MKDYYKILGVDRQASTEQIKKAYRSLAKKYHPDVVKDDKAKQERMYEIQEAYACLENEERRKKYDAECLKSPRNTVNAKRQNLFWREESGYGTVRTVFRISTRQGDGNLSGP